MTRGGRDLPTVGIAFVPVDAVLGGSERSARAELELMTA